LLHVAHAGVVSLTRLLCLAAGLVVAAHAAPPRGDPCQFDTVYRLLEQNIGITAAPVEWNFEVD
jgi:hypothetical protein